MEKFKNQSPFTKTLIMQTNNHNMIEPTKIKIVLEECYFIISDLKAKNKELQDELNLKKTTIQKLVQQKKDYILHLSQCSSDHLKKKLQVSSKRCEQMRQNLENAMDNYQKIIKKYQIDIEKLKGFNKVLRVQNQHLRCEVSLMKSTRRVKEKMIGSITQPKPKQAQFEENRFQLTVNRSQCLIPNSQLIASKLQNITPQKIITSKSTNLSTAAKSSHKSTSIKHQIPRNLFHNSGINDPSSSIRHSNQSNSESTINSAQNQLLGIWFARLKKLLAESDTQN